MSHDGTAWTHGGAQSIRGRIEAPKRPRLLSLFSGYHDDPRQHLDANAPRWALALHAWMYQEGWGLEEHRSFWIAALPLRPFRRGQRAIAGTTAVGAFQLRRWCLDDAEIASALCYEEDSLRHARAFEVGRLLDESADGPPLPRVYAAHEDAPDFTFINLPVPDPRHTPRHPADGWAVAARAMNGYRAHRQKRRDLLAWSQSVR